MDDFDKPHKMDVLIENLDLQIAALDQGGPAADPVTVLAILRALLDVIKLLRKER